MRLNDSNATEKLGEQLGRNLRGGEVIELISDLGGGKTTLVRGLARGAGSTDHVSSPTYTISNIYNLPNVKGSTSHKLAHYDFYRLGDIGLMAHEIDEVLEDEQSIVVVEWGEIVKDVLPTNRLKIHLQTTGESARLLTIMCPKSLDYLLEGLE